MPRLIWVFAGCTLTLLVLSRGGSNVLKKMGISRFPQTKIPWLFHDWTPNLHDHFTYCLKSELSTIHTIKLLKIWTPEKIAVITLKFEQSIFTVEKYIKSADRMANSVDSEQTRSSLIWVYTICSDLSVQKFRTLRYATLQKLASNSCLINFSFLFVCFIKF